MWNTTTLAAVLGVAAVGAFFNGKKSIRSYFFLLMLIAGAIINQLDFCCISPFHSSQAQHILCPSCVRSILFKLLFFGYIVQLCRLFSVWFSALNLIIYSAPKSELSSLGCDGTGLWWSRMENALSFIQSFSFFRFLWLFSSSLHCKCWRKDLQLHSSCCGGAQWWWA